MRIFTLLVLSHLLFSCKSLPVALQCSTRATVVDYSGLDGCGLLLQIADGKLLLPINGDEFDLMVGESVIISYHQADGMSICMKEDQIVELTCLQPVKSAPCADINSLEDAGWLVELRDQWMPSQIVQYRFQEFPVYLIATSIEERWYNCHGSLLCKSTAPESCRLDTSQLTDKVELYVAHR